MKIKYECRYDVEEVAKMIEDQHAAKNPLPEGMVWNGVFESYSGVTVLAIPIEAEKNTEDK